jgi:hypothetical protein
MFKMIENSLEHCITFTYMIHSETMEIKAAVCIIHHKKVQYIYIYIYITYTDSSLISENRTKK